MTTTQQADALYTQLLAAELALRLLLARGGA